MVREAAARSLGTAFVAEGIQTQGGARPAHGEVLDGRHARVAALGDDPARPANFARFIFFSPRATDLYVDWDDAADTAVALLRTAAGRDPFDKGLSDLIGELSTRSEEFRTRWATHIVRLHQTGRKQFHHPVVGALDLTFDVMDLAANPGLKLVAYTAEPGSASADALTLLASWAATLDQDAQSTPNS